MPQLRFELSNEIYAPALGKHPFFTFCHSCLPSESRKIYSTSFCTLSSLSLQFKPSTAKWCKVSRALPCWLVASLPALGEGAPKCSICHLWVSHESPCHILPYLKHLKTCEIAWNRNIFHMGMDQYLLIPFLVGWTSIYQLFWCSPGVLLVLTHCLIFVSTFLRQCCGAEVPGDLAGLFFCVNCIG